MDISGMQLRALRAAVFTALIVTLSAGSHVLLSRAPLPLSTVVLVSAGVFAVAFALSGRERRFWQIAALAVPLELAADTVFTTGQAVCYGPAGGPVSGSLRAVGLDVLCGGGSLGAPLPVVPVAGGGPVALLQSPDPALPWLLLAVHVAVGLLAATWLRHGESALYGLLRAVGSRAVRPLLLAVAVVVTGTPRPLRRPSRPAQRRTRTSRSRLFSHSVGRRGPPRSAAVFA